MAKRNLNLAGAVRYIQSVRVAQLDGLHQALHEKLTELDVQAAPGSARKYEFDGEVTGNLRGILDWLKCLTKENAGKGDIKSLRIVHDVVCQRCDSSGYKPKGSTEE
jgi:hypothetical protein